MSYFFDTNVIIGYLFYDTDRLGPRAANRIDDNEMNHTGFTTSTECFGNNGHSGRAGQILGEISSELLVIREMLRNKGLTSFRLQFNPQTFSRTGMVIRQYLDSGKFTEEDKFRELEELALVFETAYFKRKRHIRDPHICTWHPKRSNPYDEEGSRLSSKIHNCNDVQVLLDAYEAGKSVDDLLVVTDDHRDILCNKELIVRTLSTVRDVISP